MKPQRISTLERVLISKAEKDGPLYIEDIKEVMAALLLPGQEPDFASSIASVMANEAAEGSACGWRSCTGCHETNEGYETGHFPYSVMLGCYVGSGCSECGGIGAVWEYWTKSDLDAMVQDEAAAVAKVTKELPTDIAGAMSYLETGGLGEVVMMTDAAYHSGLPSVSSSPDMVLAMCILAQEAVEARHAARGGK